MSVQQMCIYNNNMNAFDLGFHSDIYRLIYFRLGIMINTTELDDLVPV